MKIDIARYVAKCDTCRRVKAIHMKTAGPLQSLPVGTMLRRRRSCRKRQLRLKLLVRDAEGNIHEASV